MKKSLVFVMALLISCLPKFAMADVGAATLVLNAVTVTGVSATQDVSKASFVRVQCNIAGTSLVTVETQSLSTLPWYTEASFDSASKASWYYSLPVTMKVRLNVTTCAGCTVSCSLETHAISK